MPEGKIQYRVSTVLTVIQYRVSTVLTVHSNTVQYSTVKYNRVNTVQYSTVQSHYRADYNSEE